MLIMIIKIISENTYKCYFLSSKQCSENSVCINSAVTLWPRSYYPYFTAEETVAMNLSSLLKALLCIIFVRVSLFSNFSTLPKLKSEE